MTLNVVSAPVTTSIGVSGQNALRYTQPDGTVATLRVSGRQRRRHLRGTNGDDDKQPADSSPPPAPMPTLASIVVTNATKKDAMLSVTTNGSSHVATIGTITDTGNLRSLVGTAVDLTGNLTVGGLGLLRVKSYRRCDAQRRQRVDRPVDRHRHGRPTPAWCRPSRCSR